MDATASTYLVVGGGLTGVKAIEGIRKLDADGSILMLCSESHLPYDRPPLSKKLWTGKKQVEDIVLEKADFYAENGVRLEMGRTAVQLDPHGRSITDHLGSVHRYEKLLLATGGVPRALPIPGGDSTRVSTFRTLDDYTALRSKALPGRSATVIGGGFIGTEMAAALNMSGVSVTLISGSPWIVDRVFPEDLGRALAKTYRDRGVRILSPERPTAVVTEGERLLTRTDGGNTVSSDMVVVGIGIEPAVDLAREAGIETDGGIVVDEYLCSSVPGVFAAGDVASFPYEALGRRMRLEHWDNALHQGRQAGMNMAGAQEPYTYMPYFYSDLFEFGYEAVGDVDARLQTVADWQTEFRKGVVYYLRDGVVRGAMMCDLWGKVEAAREVIRSGGRMAPSDLRGLIS